MMQASGTPSRARGWLRDVAAVTLVLSAAGLGLVGPAGWALAQEPPRNVQASRDGETRGASRDVTDFSEVMLAIDPTDPDHLLGCSKFFYAPARYGFFTGVLESFDGGLTWDQSQPTGVERYSLTSDPVTAFDHAGNGHFTLLTRRPTGLDMLRKPAGGDWGPPVVVDRTTVTDKQWIAADQDPLGASPYAGHLYMSWTAIGREDEPTRIAVSRSIDGNASWAQPPRFVATGGVQGSVPAVAPDGTVHVVYGRNVFGGGVAGALEVVTSRDGGETFGSAVHVANTVAVPFQLPNAVFRTPGSMPGFAVSPATGALFVAWADYRHGDADVFLATSDDGGTSWRAPVRLNDDAVGNGVDQFQPQVAVAPTGRVAVSWFDRRLPCPDLPWVPRDHVGRDNFCIDTYIARSYDEGATWSANRRVSAQTWDWSLNLPTVTEGVGFIGDYQGLASSATHDIAFWNATAHLGDNPDHRQQIFVARVPASPPTPGPSPTPGASTTPIVTTTAAATTTPGITTTATPDAPAPLLLPWSGKVGRDAR